MLKVYTREVFLSSVGFGGMIGSGLSDNLLGYGGYDGVHQSYSSTNSALYFGIPFGLRLNARAFVAGAGIMCYFPFNSSSSLDIEAKEMWKGARGNEEDSVEFSKTDDTFAFTPFMTWFIDIGFDISGRDRRTRGFGMTARLAFPLTEKMADSDKLHYEVYRRDVSFSLVLNYSFAVAAFPIGGK
ncbi:MAG: hypothetical protein LBS57_11255 [Treponema sp.]|jgi:hypothetical protein|nr:hypothetical protein [Treponema sp.]